MARKILLADDSVTAQNMGRKILVDAGYDVLTVNNGSAALKRITESKPDLIVLDVYMPGYSGLEVCQRLKEAPETAHIPVLLTVGKLEPFKPEEARRVKADGHIVKPFEASELLSALARLEDRMVPSSDGPRFSAKVAGVERFEEDSAKPEVNADPDTGWKSRLRFPSKKKKVEEPEPEEDTANFREFRKGKGKAAGVALPTNAPTPVGQEPGLVPDIPRDITPEELDVLSALAAKLDGPIPEAENIASLAEKVGPALEATPAKAEEAVAAPAEAKAAEEPKKEFEVTATAPEVAVSAAPAIEIKNEVEIPVEHTEPVNEPVTAEATAKVAEVAMPEAVSAASFAQEAAPIDQQDEPIFAAAPVEEKIEAKVVDAVESVETSAPAEAVAAQADEPKVEEQKKEEPKAEEAKAADVKKEDEKAAEPVSVEPVPSVAASAQNTDVAEAPAPSDEELAEALRLLTPSTTSGESSMPSPGVLAAAGQMLAEEAARNASAGPRWIAQAVALSPEEAAMSLEAEMFRTFAAKSTAGVEAAVIDRVSMITAAVESRLAEASLIPAVTAGAGGSSSEAKPAAEAPLATQATSEVEQKASASTNAEVAPEEAAPAATFADAAAQQDAEPATVSQGATEHLGAPAVEAVAAAGDENQDSSFESGGQDDMGKDGKGKAGSSKWHQIHTPAAGAAAKNDVVEAAKQEAASEEAPKAMAAAAAAEGSGTASGSDANAIASIVDSVLADLRPKIVEEIAKKLGKK